MRQVQYRDNSPSREVEEWETTCQEQMNELYKECENKKSIMNVRDRLNNLKDLVTVSSEASIHSDHLFIKESVGHVLYFHVLEQIKLAEEELSWIQIQSR